MSTSRWHYARSLSEQLRVNGVPETKVREIVAQVEAHIKATGEDPVEAFGQPVDYAAEWQPLGPRRWFTQLLLGVVLAAGVLAIVKVVTSEQGWFQGVPLDTRDLPHFGLFVGLLAVMPWTIDLWLSRRRGSRLGESERPTEWPFKWAALIVLVAVVTSVAGFLGEPAGRVLFTVSRWLLLVLGLATLPILLFGGPHPGMDSHPRAPGESGDESPWRTRVRRAFINR